MMQFTFILTSTLFSITITPIIFSVDIDKLLSFYLTIESATHRKLVVLLLTISFIFLYTCNLGQRHRFLLYAPSCWETYCHFPNNTCLVLWSLPKSSFVTILRSGLLEVSDFFFKNFILAHLLSWLYRGSMLSRNIFSHFRVLFWTRYSFQS